LSRVPWGTLAGGGVLLLLAGVGGALLFLTRPFQEAAWVPAPSGDPAHLYPRGGGLLPGEEGEGSTLSAGEGGGGVRGVVVSPFHLQVDPMARLLLVNFEGDPDRIYRGFEPQAFDDDVHGEGLLVIGWRVDGRVDVFHAPGLRLSEATFGIAGDGLHAMVERPFDDAHFRVGPRGAELEVDFEDLEGRPVHLRVLETDPRPRRPFGLLAPMGDAATNPPALPLVFLHAFDFVREAGSEIRIEIDGRRHAPDRLPLPLDGARVTFLRYSPDPFIVTWNPAQEGPLAALEAALPAPGAPFRVEGDGVTYELVLNGDHPEIRAMMREEGDHGVRVEFAPAFPHLLALGDGVRVEGTFRISAHPSVGVVTGRWQVVRQGRRFDLEAVPDGGWTPRESKPVVRLLYRVVPTFRDWPRSYRWQGTVEVAAGDVGGGEAVALPGLHLRSAWERIPR